MKCMLYLYVYILQQFVHYFINKYLSIIYYDIQYSHSHYHRQRALPTVCFHSIIHGITPPSPCTHPLCIVLQLSVPHFCMVSTISLNLTCLNNTNTRWKTKRKFSRNKLFSEIHNVKNMISLKT